MSQPARTPARSEGQLPELMARVALRDETALKELFDATHRRLLGVVQMILNDASAAEDVVVELFSRLWQKAADYDARKGSVLLWLSTIARRRAIDRVRARRVRSEQPLEPEITDPLEAEGPTPFESSEGLERAGLVRAALHELPTEQRRVIEAAFYRGLSHTEVATTLGHPLGTVKSRMRTGLATLKQRLAAV